MKQKIKRCFQTRKRDDREGGKKSIVSKRGTNPFVEGKD